jgi:hypothetical protein
VSSNCMLGHCSNTSEGVCLSQIWCVPLSNFLTDFHAFVVGDNIDFVPCSFVQS